MDDAEAIALLKAGDIRGLQRLVETYQVQAVQAAVLILQDRAAAEDVVQNAFLRSFERIAQFDPARPFRPWFLRMVINDALKAANHHRRLISIDDGEDESPRQLAERLAASAEEPESLVERGEVKQAVSEALQKLSPRQRAVIVQRYFLGLGEREMSTALGCAPGTIKWRLSTARRRLKALLLSLVEQGD